MTISVWCKNCNRLMVDHKDHIHVCIECEARVEVNDFTFSDGKGYQGASKNFKAQTIGDDNIE